MGDNYAEAGVKRKETAETILIRIGLVVVTIGFFLFSFQSSFLLIFGTLGLVAMIYFFPRLTVSYEYIYCDGQIDFDKIMGSDKRKTALRIDFENLEIAAPEGSHALDSYQQNTALKVRDFTSKDSSVKPFALIVREGNETLKILFEPSEKMINCMKNKAPRKVVAF